MRIIETISVPEDETCFLLVESGADVDIVAVLARAGLRVNRISPAQSVP